MKRRKQSKGYVRVEEIADGQAQVAEHLRRAYKQLRWAAQNIAAMYELMKPEEAPRLTDPNQLMLFQDEEQS